jgi:hypothetical protein
MTRIRRPNPSQLVPWIAIGTSGTPSRRAKYAGPSFSGPTLDSNGWIRPSPAIATTPPAARTAWTRRVATRRSFLPGRYGMVVPVQVISRFRPPTDMSSSFGPKNASRGRIGSVAINTNGSAQLRWLKQ